MFENMYILSKEQVRDLPEWLPIEGFPKYEVNCREGLVRNARTLRVLKPSNDGYGYPFVGLMKDGKRVSKSVHRIVALTAFAYYNISTEGLDVCHLDEERNDPRISNLALGSHKENLNFEKAKQRMSETQPKKAVGGYKNGELILKFRSTREAGRNGFDQRHVSACCRGKLKHHKGYEWRYLSA